MAKAKVAVNKLVDEDASFETAATPVVEESKGRATRGGSDKFVFQKDLTADQKFAPQALLIIKHVKANNTITRDQLIEELSKDPEFKTKQPIGRIVSYYQKDLVNAGIFTVEK